MGPVPFILLNFGVLDPDRLRRATDPARGTRQAERDKIRDRALQEHHDAEVQRQQEFEARQTELLARARDGRAALRLLAQNTQLTEQIARLTSELHQAVCVAPNAKT